MFQGRGRLNIVKTLRGVTNRTIGIGSPFQSTGVWKTETGERTFHGGAHGVGRTRKQTKSGAQEIGPERGDRILNTQKP